MRIVINPAELRSLASALAATQTERERVRAALLGAPLPELPPSCAGEVVSGLRRCAHRAEQSAELLERERRDLLRRAERMELDLARPSPHYGLRYLPPWLRGSREPWSLLARRDSDRDGVPDLCDPPAWYRAQVAAASKEKGKSWFDRALDLAFRDDARTLGDPKASFWSKALAAASLVPLPVGKGVKAISLGAKAASGARKAENAVDAGRAAGKLAPGPGAWTRVNESMSARARAYQAQITGRADEAYVVNGVKFDAYKAGVGSKPGLLVDAKGPGYAGFVKGGRFADWFENSPRGGQAILKQAESQIRVSGDLPIRWHVAEREAVVAIRRLLRENNVRGIEIVHTARRLPS